MTHRRLTVKQLAEAVGVSPKTIRRYERAGLLPKAQRAVNGYRVYTEDDVQEITRIIFPEETGQVS